MAPVSFFPPKCLKPKASAGYCSKMKSCGGCKVVPFTSSLHRFHSRRDYLPTVTEKQQPAPICLPRRNQAKNSKIYKVNILWNFSEKSCRKLQKVAESCSLRNFANLCETLRTFAKLCGTFRNFSELCGTFRNFVELFGTLWNFSELCESFRNFAKVFGTLWNFSELCESLRDFAEVTATLLHLT
jgi:hypothetical protein